MQIGLEIITKSEKKIMLMMGLEPTPSWVKMYKSDALACMATAT